MERLKLLLYGVFSYLHLDKEVFGILMILMCFDSIVGAVKAVRLGDEFQFRALLWGISMKLIFLMIPVVLALMGKSLGYDFHLAINIIMALLTVSEVYSIMGNIYSAKNKVRVKKIDVVSMVLISLRKMLSKAIDNLLSTLENLGKNQNEK